MSFTLIPVTRAGAAVRRKTAPLAAGLAVMFLAVTAAFAQVPLDEVLPKLRDLELPTAETLLRSKPFDWVVLKDSDEVLVVEPVAPRPDTLNKMDAEYRRLNELRGKTKEEQDEIRDQKAEMRKLQVTLLNAGDDSDFTVDTKIVKEIIYHEDLVLRRVSKCIDENLTAIAFELLVYLDRRHPNWPGYQRQVNQLLLREIQVQLSRNELEAALRFSEELYSKDATFPGLSEAAGQVVDRLVGRAVEERDYRRSRHFLARLTQREPQHPIVEKWRAQLAALCQTKIDEARAAALRNDGPLAASLIDEAARIWPEAAGLREAHRELTNRYAILHVGVLQLPSDSAPYAFPTDAQLRARQLTAIDWFEASSYDERGMRHHSVPCEAWEPDDLGREIRFDLRRERADWESRPLFTSATLTAALAARMNPASSDYDERLAAAVAGVAAPSPYKLTVQFRRPPLQPEALFRLSLPAGAESPELNADLPGLSTNSGLRFQMIADGADTCRFIRLRSEPNSMKQRHVAEIREQRYADWDHLLQSLLRGDISAVPRVNSLDVAGLRDDPRFFVLPYAQPVSHLIQINPRSRAMQNGQLRRALLHGIHRDKILSNELLAGVPNPGSLARLTASPFTLSSPAYNRLLAHPSYDPILSAGLAATARKELGGTLPTLKIMRPPEVEIGRVVDAFIREWGRVGIEVVVAESAADEWDLAYRTMQFREPLLELWPFLLNDPAATMTGLEALPERLRRQILDIERATDWSSANRLLQRLQIDLLIDARWIPLWEKDEFLLVRKNVSGLPEKMVYPYQGAERWIVQSWYPTETP